MIEQWAYFIIQQHWNVDVVTLLCYRRCAIYVELENTVSVSLNKCCSGNVHNMVQCFFVTHNLYLTVENECAQSTNIVV